jgi:hypothetical protein
VCIRIWIRLIAGAGCSIPLGAADWVLVLPRTLERLHAK